MRNVKCFMCVYALSYVYLVHSLDMPKEELDKVIEDEITQKLSVDLLQSMERKFQVDLEKSVDMVLVKIKMLLQNGTTHIQDKLVELQGMLDIIRNEGEKTLDRCLTERHNETAAIAEKALHQMVVCGYALIGHDPAKAVSRVMELKSMITAGVKPIYDEKNEIYGLLKVCGHDHETLKKVIKCVISKSTIIKSAMMDITTKLIEGVVDLTKMMAHGAMHEACLIEVVKSTEDEAFDLIKSVRHCANGNETVDEVKKYIAENNATVLDINLKRGKTDQSAEVKDAMDMKTVIRRMLTDDKHQDLDKKLKKKQNKMQKDLESDYNQITDGKDKKIEK